MIRKTALLAWLCLALVLVPGATPFAADLGIQPLAPSGAPAQGFPLPDRPVAEIVSPIWATEEQRDKVDEAGQLARHLGIRPGQTVADIGAGSGYHTVRYAKVVGPTGRVLAQDVMPDYLAGLARRVKGEGLANVTLGLSEAHDPRLPTDSVDVALLVHMYHEIRQPFAFLHNLAPALKPGAKVGIVDLDAATWQHGTPRDLLTCELAAVGYRQIAFHRLTGDIGYLAMFEGPRARAQEAVRDRALQAAVALRPTRKRSRQPFFSALALCAASFPDLPLLTMYRGSSLEAATLWPLTFVGVVCFLTTLPVL